MKRTISLLSFTGLLCLCLFALSPSASAAEVVDSGYCGGEGDGTNLTWTLTDDGVLTIKGEGEMEEYDFGYSSIPWYNYRAQIQSIVVDSPVTSIGDYAFANCNVLEDVSLPESLVSIGYYSFGNCRSLLYVSIPESTLNIGDLAFCDCDNLRIVFALGDAPAKVNEAFPGVPLIHPEDANPWTEDWGAIPYAWDETVSSTAATLDLIDGSITLCEMDGVTYCFQAGVAKATTGGVLIRQTNSGSASTENTITVSGGSCAVSISSLNVSGQNAPIDIKSRATLDLTLLGSSILTSTNSAAICVPGTATLTISGNGILNAISKGGGAAGIGGDFHRSGGTIIINNGTVTAYGSLQGAGIGGGIGGDGGTITINGGTVTVYGGAFGAGIGGGSGGAGGTITINNGIVTTMGGSDSAGIGGGDGGGGGTITITGGVISSKGGSWGSDIGSGYYGEGGSLAITGGTISAAHIGAVFEGFFDAVTISDQATVANADGEAACVVETIFMDTQPLTTAVHNGNIPILSVAAHNHSGISYQWQVSTNGSSSWTDLEGQTSAQTTFPMSADLNGKYVRCQLTNGWGNVEYTDAVQVWTLAFSQQPVSVEANLNDLVAFNAASTCSNVTYQWQRSYDDGQSWVDVPGETYGTLAVNATLSESSAKYRCVITATNGDQLASDMVEIKLDAGALVTYTTRYYQQNPDGQGYTLVNQQVLEGISGQTVTIPETSYEGFTENTQAGTLTGTVTGDSSLVLARYYDRNTYQITFQMNGGSVLPPLEARHGADITAPSNPSRFAYTFAGWYADEALTEEYSFTTMPLGGTTVYAKWTPVGADRGIEYKINGLAVRDISTFAFLDAIPDGKFLVEVSVTNLCATAIDTILLVQYTDQGQMLGMQYLYASTQAGQTVTFGASVDNTDGKIGKIKAMILPSLGSPVPLANAVEMM